MNLTRERKIIVSVLAVAVAALLLDRLFAGSAATGPSVAEGSAPAAAVDAADPPVADPPAVDAAADDAACGGLSSADCRCVAGQLEGVRQRRQLSVTNVGDAFRPSSAWAGQPRQFEADAPQESPEYAADVFARGHVLSAVMKGQRGGHAIINGRIVRLSEQLDGFRLVAIADDTVIMESRGARVRLKLNASTAPAGARTTRIAPAPQDSPAP